MTKRKTTRKVNLDKLEAEIMDWFYETVKVNFGVDMVQDATELRDILEFHITPLNRKL